MKNVKFFFDKETVKRLWNDERGQSTTEYILILSVVVMIAIKFKTAFGSKIDSIVTKLGGDIDQNISN
jgi:Flp pilus assembly pilin Flp